MKFRIAPRRAQTAAGLALAVLLTALPLERSGASVTGELVVADQLAGVALYGFDPVSYFIDGGARVGSGSFELSFDRLTWRFRSEANRAAFRAEPDAYVPRFGGYDPVALIRGVPVEGHPTIFAVHDGRLFLFHKPENRSAFLADPGGSIEAARTAWPTVRRSLVH